MNSVGNSSEAGTATTDWLAQHSISVTLTCPRVAQVIARTVVRRGNRLVAEFSKASLVIHSEGSIIRNSFVFPELIQARAPLVQYSGFAREGVPPRTGFSFVPTVATDEPNGMRPRLDSLNRC